MAWPENSQVTSTIIHDDFYGGIEKAATQRFYPMFTEEKDQADITATYTSFGSVSEPHQMSGTLGGGPQQAAIIKDWILPASVVEWDNTIYFRRLIARSKPNDVRNKATQMAFKAQKFMDKQLLVSLQSTTAGYDGVQIISSAHPESGTNQTNTSTTAGGGGGASTTAAQIETALTTAVAQMLKVVDDQGTPVCEGIDRFMAIVHPTQLFQWKSVVSPLMGNSAQPIPGTDVSGVTGKFRGMVDIKVSAYCTTTGLVGGATTQAFLFADPQQVFERAVWLCKLADWQFNDNIENENSDLWNQGQGYLRSWAAFIFMPGKWQMVQNITFS